MAKILAVDDTLLIRSMVEAVLKSAGHEVILASDGVDALEIARTHQVDLVLSDINMPIMNGISLVSKLRLLDGYKFTPIIMLTTESSDFKKQKAKAMGATGWLQKPFTPERLLAAIERLA
ncbi:MAG: two-component system chemotaxis family response regulator CheY [Halothiobacillaceae bacterium]|nr:MAG: two-component system chemotaxis family response regulator CheY [Halothiobacillaceae bacterium]